MTQDVVLVIESGPQAGLSIPLPHSIFLVGRHARCHLRPASAAVSSHHCAVFMDGSRVLVRDLNSRTGTVVNECPVQGEVALQAGDRLRVGPLTLVLRNAAELEEDLVANVLLAPASVGHCQGQPETVVEHAVEHSLPSARRRQEAEIEAANYEDIRRRLPQANASLAAEKVLRNYRYRPDARG